MRTIVYGICAVMSVLWAVSEAKAAHEAADRTSGAGHSAREYQAAMIGSVPTDSATFAACRREALAGDVAACKALGACYADPAGEFVSRNLRASLNWYLKAAEARDAEAQRLAGEAWLMLGDDLEEPRPLEVGNARYWLGRAAEQGDSEARELLGELPAGDAATDDALQIEAPTAAGRMEPYPAYPEEYARLLNAVDAAAAHGTRLITPQDRKHGVIVGRSCFEELRDRLLSGDDYGAPTYRAALDSIQAHHVIRSLRDMGTDYMLLQVKKGYDNQRPDWSPYRKTGARRYETTDLGTLFDYVVEKRAGKWLVYRKPTGAGVGKRGASRKP